MKSVTLPTFLLFSIFTFAQVPIIEFKTISTGLNEPTDIVNAGDGTNRIFISERVGFIRIWDGTSLSNNYFLDISSLTNAVTSSEGGLLSIAFHPDYKNNRYFYVYYANQQEKLILARYRTKADNPAEADASSAKIILSIPRTESLFHNGGKLAFDDNGYLYLGIGDGSPGQDPNLNAQNGELLSGKMIRIDVSDFDDPTEPYYNIPHDNPYVSDPNIRDEIIALGLRNPWRWCFDKLTGDMWIGDVGQDTREEVNFRPKDSLLKPTNYGWRCFEGKEPNPNEVFACPVPANNVLPIYEYLHTNAGASITGGNVYRGSEFPLMYGWYLCTDYIKGGLLLIKRIGEEWQIVTQESDSPKFISTFGEGEDGTLYAARLTDYTTQSSGVLYKIESHNNILPLKLLSFTGTVLNDTHLLQWECAGVKMGDTFIVERLNENSGNYETLTSIKAAEPLKSNFEAIVSAIGRNSYYRLKIVDNTGSISYSSVVLITSSASKTNKLFEAVVKGDRVDIQLLQPSNMIQVVDAAGVVLYKKTLKQQVGSVSIPLRNIPHGILFIKVLADKKTETRKILN